MFDHQSKGFAGHIFPTLIRIKNCSKGKRFPGDEIFSVNGRSVAGLTHSEAILMFKETKVGGIQVTLGRREAKKTASQDC